MKASRLKSIEDAGRLRALLSAKLAAMSPIDMGEIVNIPEVLELGMKRQAVEAVVYSMVRAGTLVKSNNPLNASHKLYSIGTGKVPVAKAAKPVARSTKPNIQVDIIKSTGRVRLTIDCMIIEVGVIS